MRAILALMFAACSSDTGGLEPTADATGGACPELAETQVAGTTPFGAIDMQLDSFRASDCITIAAAAVALRDSSGASLELAFSYSPESDVDGRRFVTGDFSDDTAQALFESASGDREQAQGAAAVRVGLWQEGSSPGHAIDIEVSFSGTDFDIPPIAVRGTFCEWDFLACTNR